MPAQPRSRPSVALFDYADVFEDFYPHFGVDQKTFAHAWSATSNHAFAALIQERIADVTWYELSLRPEITAARHEIGFDVRFVRSSMAHRLLWRSFYERDRSWRLRRFYRQYALMASYLAPASVSLWRAAMNDHPDAIFVQDYSSGRFDVLFALSRALRVPVITYHAGSTDDHFVGRPLRRLTLRRADKIIASSNREVAALAERFGIPRDHCEVILTPIDTELFSPIARNDACKQADMDPTHRHVLFVGRLDDRVKNISVLIRAMATLDAGDDVSLVIVGDGPDRHKLELDAARLLGDRVSFRGWANDRSTLASMYNAAEVLVLPSVSEGFPTVVGEAMSCGTPVVASDVGGISELVVDDETGYLVPSGDHDELARAIHRLLADQEGREERRGRVREAALSKVSPAVVAAQLQRVFADVLGRR